METIQPYLLPAGVGAFLLYRYLRFKAARARLPALKAEGAIFVDVRSPGEFAAGNKPGSLNIPLDELAEKAAMLDKSKPIILSCASGARSGAAVGILKKLGFNNATNAGPWQNTL